MHRRSGCRRSNGYRTALVASRTAKEFRIQGVCLRGRSIEAFQFEGLRCLDILILDRHGIYVRAPNLQLAGILLVIKRYYTIHGTGLIRHVRISSYSHE